jgi:hypothetical protein
MSRIEFSFVIVTYNSAESIGRCLYSIFTCTAGAYEIIIVDNSPDRRTVGAVRDFLTANPEAAVQLVEPTENLGFSRGCNTGARLAQGEFLFFLNPDTELLNDAAGVLAGCLGQHPRCLAAGPAIFNAAGDVTRTCRNLPNLRRIFLETTGLDNWCGAYKLTRFRHDVSRQVDQIIGAAILVRRNDYERLGGMDERFFVYFEEVDFCKRLKDSGGEIWFWPSAGVHHLSGSSCEVGSVRARMIYVLRESRRKYFEKHFGSFSAAALECINRLEGVQKAAVLAALWLVRRERSYRDKAFGFWSVVTGIAPRV